MATASWGMGSQWHRWDPHIHAPGTLANDQFGGKWDAYLNAIETATPTVAALGITDYCTLRSYIRVLEYRRKGRLNAVNLLFPNVEFRLGIQTRDGPGINFHLLICPDDPSHVARAAEALAQLTFGFGGGQYPCSDEGLIRLGRAFSGKNEMKDEEALRIGAQQFKVELSKLADLRARDSWVRQNVLFAVAAGKDGLGGLAKDDAFKAQRLEIGRLADIIFSATPSDRDFWNGTAGKRETGQRAKPCLHGSDAHSIEKVLKPDQERRCWIRSTPTFEGLRQTLAEPERRVVIGSHPPNGPTQANVIKALSIQKASWAKTSHIALNDGLVTVIGARGSGKTALLDLLAYALRADDPEPGHASFLAKAGRLLDGTTLEVGWANGQIHQVLYPRETEIPPRPPVRYLSQQFVERLCSSDLASAPLVEEIESVVFDAIPVQARLGCTSFEELRTLKLRSVSNNVASLKEQIRALTAGITKEREMSNKVDAVHRDYANQVALRKSLETELSQLPTSSNDIAATRYAELVPVLDQLREAIAESRRRKEMINELNSAIRFDQVLASDKLKFLKDSHPGLLSDEQWELLRFRPDPKAATTLADLANAEDVAERRLTENGLHAEDVGATYAGKGLADLEAEEKSVAAALGADRDRQRRKVALAKRLEDAKKLEGKLGQHREFVVGAKERLKELQRQRMDNYGELFVQIAKERSVLDNLYQPMRALMDESDNLAFSVQLRVDYENWIRDGERLLDFRRQPFQGRSLLDLVKEHLLPCWRNGDAASCKEALSSFIQQYGSKATAALASGVALEDFGKWLFNTDHIRVEYSIQYEGASLGELSPGTRGVVLLKLFLLLDRLDDRPLVIDQPEENLDPKSVFAELVPGFIEAAKRRQIIMVTHNANLVVNTDSDQVIVASSKRVAERGLPEISYAAGGLEDPHIRKEICALLEGGEDAFRKRGERYGMQHP